MVAEYRVPTYRVDLSLPDRKNGSGERLVGYVSVNYFTGKPAIDAEVEVVLETGESTPPTVSVFTDEQGNARFEIPVPYLEEDRKLVLRATAMDASGQTYTQSGEVKCTASAFREAKGGGEVADASPKKGRPAPPPRYLEIGSWQLPERIDAGQPLAFDVRIDGPKDRRASLAVIAENNRLLDCQVLHVASGEHRVVIPTSPDWAPSLQVALVLLDGRRDRVKTQSCYLRPRERFLTLSVETDKAEYKPGEKCTVLIAATDHRGRVVPRTEISLGVVDASLYRVREDPTPDLAKFFYEYHLPYVCRGHYDSPAPEIESLLYWLGPRYAWGYYPLSGWQGRARMVRAGGGYACSERSLGVCRLRKDFRSTAYWVADLVTDQAGRARTTFTLPDNVTDWRFTARGVTADTRVGEIRVHRGTVLPLQVELALPRGLRQGDRIQLPVVLHNNRGDDRSVCGTTKIGGGQPQPWATRRLAPRADDCLTIPIAATSAEPIAVLATVRDPTNGDTDAAERRLVPLPRGIRITRSYSGTLAKDVTIDVHLGAKPAGDLELLVRREPGLVGPIGSALDGLIDYPYGCVEQTMSRFMPAVVAAGAMRKAGIENPAAQRLPEVVSQGLGRLANFQHPDGGWGWWEHDQTNDFMTAYVLKGLALCRGADHPVPDLMIERARHYLAQQLRDDQLVGHPPGCIGDVNLQVYAAHALATVYHQDPTHYQQGMQELLAQLGSIEKNGGPPRLLGQILLADAYRPLGDKRKARSKLYSLQRCVRVEDGNRETVFVAAALLELGAALDSQNPRWQRLARRLVAVRTGSGWGDTLTGSAAVRGLAAVIDVPTANEIPVTVSVDGRKVGRLTRATGNSIRLKGADIKRISLHPAKSGCGDFYSVRLQGRLSHPPSNAARPKVIIRTHVLRLRPRRQEVVTDASGTIRLPRGKTLEVQLQAQLARPISHACLTVPRPCGVELVRGVKAADGVVAVEQRDNAFHFFIERWEKGTHQMCFLVRAEVAGTVSSPPPELELMYTDSLPTAVHAPTRWVVSE